LSLESLVIQALAALAGIGLALILVAAARLWVERELWVYAIGLLVAALVYAAAAALHAPDLLPREWLGVAFFGAVAFVGLYRPSLLSIGWALHAAWDLAFPAHRSGALLPAWYPALCIGFDLALATYLWRKRA